MIMIEENDMLLQIFESILFVEIVDEILQIKNLGRKQMMLKRKLHFEKI